MQKTPILPLLPSTSFSALHSDLDYATNTEPSVFKTVVTDNNLELSFEVDCTRVTIKTDYQLDNSKGFAENFRGS